MLIMFLGFLNIDITGLYHVFCIVIAFLYAIPSANTAVIRHTFYHDLGIDKNISTETVGIS